MFLGIAFISNLMLAFGSRIYFGMLMAQIAFYGMATLGWRRAGDAPGQSVIKIPAYFMAVNASIAVAWWRYFRRQRIVMWTPSER